VSAEPVEAPASAGLVAGAPATTSAEGSSFLRGAGFLALTTVVVSALNYLFSLALARVLPPGAFVNVVAVQSLLLVLGTGVMSAVPWVVSRQVARARGSDDETRVNRESLHFGVTGSLVQGVPVALVAGGVGWNLGGVGLGAVAALSGFALSLVAAPIGFLQGRSRFGAIAVIRLGEAVLRVGSGLTLALVLDGSPVGALAGFPMGSLALAGVGLLLCAGGFPLRRPERAATAALVRHAMWLGGVQVVLSLLGAVDTIVAAAAGLSGDEAYAYQLAALLGRVPLFLSVAVAQALYLSLARARSDDDVRSELRQGSGLYLRVAAVVAFAAWTVPLPVLAIAAPQGAALVGELLRITVLSGVLVGLLNVLTTAHQARSSYAPVLRRLVPFAVLLPVALLFVGRFGATAFALTSVALLALLTGLVAVQCRRWWSAGMPSLPGPTAVAALLAVVGLGIVADVVGLLVWVPAVGALALLLGWPYLPPSLRRLVTVRRPTRGGI